MIADYSRKELIFTPPHTGSRSLCAAYSKAGHTLIYGPNVDGYHDQHYMTRGMEFYEGWTAILTVRNPLERAVGLWYHLCEYNAYMGWGSYSFADFVRNGLKEPTMGWIYRWSIHKLCEYYCVVPDKTVEFHDLPKFCEERGLVLPVQPATFRKNDWRYYYTPELKAETIQHYEGDEKYVVY